MKERMQRSLTPVFDKEMGHRFRLMRMKKHMDQKECGKLLGVSQTIISSLERGNQRVTTFTLYDLYRVFGEDLGNYILIETHAKVALAGNITEVYWELKHAPKGRRRRWRLINGVMTSVAEKKDSSS